MGVRIKGSFTLIHAAKAIKGSLVLKNKMQHFLFSLKNQKKRNSWENVYRIVVKSNFIIAVRVFAVAQF